jgi:predicted dehydrogenase
MKPFHVVVVGTGFIGPVHVEALRRAGLQVVGIVASTPAKGQTAAMQLGIPRAYDSIEDVLKDASIDSVHLTTPNRFHFDQAAMTLKAGKHVLCEKPLAMDSKQSAELVELAKRSGKVAGVAYNIRYYPLCHEAASRSREGQVGELFHVVGSYVQDWLLFDTDFNWRVLAEEGGQLRALADIGTHWLDLIQFITNEQIVAVCADLKTVHLHRKRPEGGVETFSGKSTAPKATHSVSITTDDCGSVMLRFVNGASGCLWVSQTTAGRKNCLRFEIGGSKVALAWNSELPNELWIGHRDRPNEQLIRDPALMSSMAGRVSDYPGGHNEGFPDSFKQLFKAFYEYIEQGDFNQPPTFPTFEDGHREIVLCEAILKSHRQRCWVEI